MTQAPLSPAVLASLQQHLLARQSALRAALLATAHAALDDRAEPVTDFKESAQLRIEHALDDDAATRAARELADVAAALARLGQGRYGTCTSCGDPIPQQRLLAMPAAELCADCQSVHEQLSAAAGGQLHAARR
jgi:DnaK suppressor protein